MFTLTVAGDIAHLDMQRPQARNAIPLTGWTELAARLAEAARSPARVLILRGEPGGAFSAGADLSEFPRLAGNAAACAAFRKTMRAALDGLRTLPMPSIALIEGACYGAGVALALACDLRFAGPGARFAITPAKFGIAYPQEDVHALVALVGPGRAARLLLGAVAIDAEEAARIGLVESVAKDAGAEASTFAAAAAACDPESIAVLKQGMRLAAAGVRRDKGQDRAFDAMIGSDALAGRIAAHRERRR